VLCLVNGSNEFMSRKGKMPITLPKGVELTVHGDTVTVKGPKGTLTRKLAPGITVNQEKDILLVQADDDSRDLSRMHGLYRALISNMVLGASAGFEKLLEMIGVGYRAAVQGNLLDLQIGFSHPTKLEIPKGVQVKVEKSTLISIQGCDRQVVGQFAAEVRAIRPPEPYQGKGIRYKDEYVRRKAGKAAKTVTKAA
jgi:large subunit ribosomal protein L6